ncbi:MAG: HEAT repeat domain-containing protein, partial [Verrucomicrobiota bacterium]
WWLWQRKAEVRKCLAAGIGWSPVRAEETPDLARLEAELFDSDVKKRRQAAYTLHHLGKEALPALPKMIEGLDDDDVQVWFHLISGVGKLGPAASEAIPALIEGFARKKRRYEGQVAHRYSWALGSIGEKAIDPLIAGLEHDREQVRIGSAMALEAMAKPPVRAIEALGACLADSEEEVGVAAAKALGAMGGPAVKATAGWLTSDDERNRIGALHSAIAMGEAGASLADSLLHLAEKGGEAERSLAFEALVRVRAEEDCVVSVLLPALYGDGEDLRHAAVNGLLTLVQRGQLGVGPFVEVLKGAEPEKKARAADFLGRMGDFGIGGTPALLEVLKELPAGQEGEVYVDALGNLGAGAAPFILEALSEVPAEKIDENHWGFVSLKGFEDRILVLLEEALVDPSASVRLTTTYLLQHLDDRASSLEGALLSAFDDSHAGVRAGIVGALTAAGTETRNLFPILEKAAQDDEAIVRQATAASLQEIENEAPQVLKMLEPLLEDEDAGVRAETLKAIGALGEESAHLVAPIAEMVSNPLPGDDPALAAVTLSRMGKAAAPALPSLLPLLDASETLQAASLRALAGIGPLAREGLPRIKELLQADKPEVRASALEAYAAIEGKKARVVVALQKGLRDESEIVREPSVSLLGDLGEEARPAARALFAMLEGAGDDEPILDALRSIKSRDIKLYQKAITSKKPGIRLFACEALGRLGKRAEPALPELRKALRDRYDFVRRRARDAIRRIEKDSK